MYIYTYHIYIYTYGMYTVLHIHYTCAVLFTPPKFCVKLKYSAVTKPTEHVPVVVPQQSQYVAILKAALLQQTP